MSLFGLFILLLVASICGSIGTALAGYSSRGCLTNIVLGFIGAILGGWLSREMGIREILYVADIPIVWSIIGSALFVLLIGILTGKHFDKKKKS